MSLPFTRAQFLEVFRTYHDAIGPAPVLLLTMAVSIVALAYSARSWRHRAISGLLAGLWLWTGVVYHWGFFSAINPAARLFGAFFVVQATLLVVFGVIRTQWHFDPRQAPNARAGWLLIVYALVIYPLLGVAFGHGYPNGPSFGAPCPVTIFFLGTTLWMLGSTLLPVIIPVIWAVIGTSAAVSLGIPEDFGLGLSAVLVLLTLIRRSTMAKHITPALTGPGIGA
jgi:hypothetical protein